MRLFEHSVILSNVFFRCGRNELQATPVGVGWDFIRGEQTRPAPVEAHGTRSRPKAEY